MNDLKFHSTFVSHISDYFSQYNRQSVYDLRLGEHLYVNLILY